MKKALITALLLAASQLFAATKDFSDISGNIMDEAAYASSFTRGKSPEINEIPIGMQKGNEPGCMAVGEDTKVCHWVSDLEARTNRTSECTISFDLVNIKGKPGQVVWALYSPGGSFERGLRVVIGKRNNLELQCKEFTGTNISTRKGTRRLGKINELKGKTITVTYDGQEREICAYVNGQMVGKAIRLTYAGETTAKSTICDLTWGDNHCGWGKIDYAAVDNVCFWPIALSEDEIKELIRFEMTPLYWGIAGGAAGLLLIIAALIIAKLKKKARPAA